MSSSVTLVVPSALFTDVIWWLLASSSTITVITVLKVRLPSPSVSAESASQLTWISSALSVRATSSPVTPSRRWLEGQLS